MHTWAQYHFEVEECALELVAFQISRNYTYSFWLLANAFWLRFRVQTESTKADNQ